LLVSALAQASWYRPASRKELQSVLSELQRAQRAIHKLALTDAWELAFFDRPVEDVDLSNEIERIASILGNQRRSQSPLRDVIRAALVRYVRRRTRRFHDDEVSVVISVAESLYDEMLNRRSSDRDVRGAARGHDKDCEPTYTAEAHRQWRTRNLKLLRRESDWERRWMSRVVRLEQMLALAPDVRTTISY
jgi:hypothetical protein